MFALIAATVTNTHCAEKRCRLLAVEILRDRRDMGNIGNLIALNNVSLTRRRKTHTTYWEKVPSTVYPLSFALEQPSNYWNISASSQRLGEVTDFVPNPCGTARIGDRSPRAT